MISISENASLLSLNTFGIDAKTRYLIKISEIQDIGNYLSSELSTLPHRILGGGSNVLFTDDFEGCIIRPAFKGIEVVSEDSETILLRVGAGEKWDDFVSYCVKNGWCGIENLSYIPGTVGACPVQNIGAYGVEVKDYIQSVEFFSLEENVMKRYSNKECGFSYRNSIFKTELGNQTIVTHVTFQLRKDQQFTTTYKDLKEELDSGTALSLHSIRDAIINIRKRKLPNPETLPNAGSFFKNPIIDKSKLHSLQLKHPDVSFHENADGLIKLSAAWLIEHAGWKGRKIRNTGTHIHQPLVIINYNKASGREILNFAQKIQDSVMDQFDIHLEMEVNII